MIFQTINKKILELGPSLGFLFKKTCTFSGTHFHLFISVKIVYIGKKKTFN